MPIKVHIPTPMRQHTAGSASVELPDGAAVFPDIPAELGVHPLLLAVVHAVVFLAGSADDVVQPDAADEALGYVAEYLRRLTGPDLRRTKEDVSALVSFAKQQS